ncbi:MAG: helix-turn-helix domain-containing protein [Nitrososphaeraceae archaeon]
MSRPVPNNTMQIKERREGFLVLLTKGMKGYEIAKELGVDASTVSRDIQYLISQSHNYLNSTLDEPLMFAGPDRVFPYGGYAGSTHFYNTATGPSAFYPEGYVGEPNQMYIFATAGDDRTPLYQFIQAMCLMTLETSLAAPQMQFMERFQV